MKKSNYLLYLNEYNKRLPNDIDKAFKQLKRTLKPTVSSKLSKQKHSFCKQSNVQMKIIRQQDKQNIQPNQNNSTYNKSKINEFKESKLIIKNLNNKKVNKIKKVNEINKTEQYQQYPQFHVSLSKCNFQPTHIFKQLYLIQDGMSKDIIVCEKCASKFSKKTKISSLRSTYHSKQSKLINLNQQSNQDHMNNDIYLSKKAQLQQKLIKITNIKRISQLNTKKSCQQIQEYYNNLIQIIINIKNELIGKIQNMQNLNTQLIQTKQDQTQQRLARLLSQNQQQQYTILNGQQSLNLYLINLQKVKYLPQTIKQMFIKSEFYIQISFLNASIKQSDNLSNNNDAQDQAIVNQNKLITVQDDQAQDQQNIQSTNYNQLKHQMDQQLYNISSSQQLLLQTLRNQQSDRLEDNKIEADGINLKQKKIEQKNIVKQLCNLSLQYSQLICQQKLNLSTSHPIHKMLQKHLYPKPIATASYSTFTKPSVICQNKNKHEISFEMDQNLIVEGNLLDSYNENYDVVSPAFKII